MEPKILVVDDEPHMTRMLKRLFKEISNAEIKTSLSGEEALQLLSKFSPEVVVTDIKMEGIDGIVLLKEILKIDPTISVILITGYGTVEMAVEALKAGAYDFIQKPFDSDHILHVVKRALERTHLLRENLRLRDQVFSCAWEKLGIIGESPAIKRILNIVERIAPTDVPVLIRGESGTGKELIARAIHVLSERREKEMVVVNCPAVPEHILESELFGYLKGAFTGANSDKKGLFQMANGSTIFLDEIGDISLNVQTKLLRVLQEKEIRPLGSTKTISVDVRIIASTNQDLEAKIKRGEFREDLYYRLNVVTLELPPLKERKEDILPLAYHFLKKYSEKYQRPIEGFSSEALEFLVNNPWPGNIRELQNVIRRAVLLCQGNEIKLLDLMDKKIEIMPNCFDILFDKPYVQAKKELVEKFSRNYIEKLLSKTQGNVTQAARLAGMERQAFQRLMRQFQIKSEDFR
ncbi:two component, sigma54 specific, transcriptional regulator, Fis family [Thermodesulfatator indicus DSM 15286]|uniref:Two component, sigma54 specific, transcriptional regulator, Fis family n=1 Tax=Thermodesulfatator indicus (strain DSM 15286 / JCM 11887 / CIR29812) TaxID=667014 RepID=F8AAW6_THEID|nr:sigma-54 dependent transcriptional regulator [Thermodesulfatator indicus]AEH45479.1 two component, sigma54 specific, transcriptional regulator, Fis family [Thermodesulfatator indicus DSM 15286]